MVISMLGEQNNKGSRIWGQFKPREVLVKSEITGRAGLERSHCWTRIQNISMRASQCCWAERHQKQE